MKEDKLDLDTMDELIREHRTDNRAIRRQAAALEIAARAPALIARVRELEKLLRRILDTSMVEGSCNPPALTMEMIDEITEVL